MGSLGTGVDALAQVHFLLRAQQRDLADLLEVVLHRVIQQLIHGSLQVCGVLLCRVVLIFIAQAQLIAVCLGTFHLCHDAFHIQAGVTVGLVIQNFDAALLQKRVKRFHIHPALGSQCLGLARRQVPSPFVNSSFKVMPISLSPFHRGAGCAVSDIVS